MKMKQTLFQTKYEAKGESHENEHLNITKNRVGGIHHRRAVYVWFGLVIIVVDGARGQSDWQ